MPYIMYGNFNNQKILHKVFSSEILLSECVRTGQAETWPRWESNPGLLDYSTTASLLIRVGDIL
jgi:hypothetical protein